MLKVIGLQPKENNWKIDNNIFWSVKSDIKFELWFKIKQQMLAISINNWFFNYSFGTNNYPKIIILELLWNIISSGNSKADQNLKKVTPKTFTKSHAKFQSKMQYLEKCNSFENFIEKFIFPNYLAILLRNYEEFFQRNLNLIKNNVIRCHRHTQVT